MARLFFLMAAVTFVSIAVVAVFWPPVLWVLVIVVPPFLLGVRDTLQPRRAILRNYPVLGHFRYLFELIRPEINQYFIESNTDGMPYSRELRSVAYQRAKKQTQTLPFGTQRDVYAVGYEWMNHSLAAHEAPPEMRITIGAGQCARPYDAALLNVSAMSFGSLSRNAILALNSGAREGGFYHNTGEGGLSPYHLRPGGDLCWQIGTGYFGCRDDHGRFDPDAFAERASNDSVKLIEIKLSQGAKPGHGGILPARKITPEIAEIRRVPMGKDVNSPPAHSAFRTPRQMLEFIGMLRERSGGKPVGIKLCVGNPAELFGLAMAMHETGLHPDFISVDGGEGGTGAAPLEFSNSIGSPLTEGLVLAHNVLVGYGLRDEITLIASGKILTGFDMAKRIAAGADLCSSARGFMFALGCIQARRCNENDCPVGVATQDSHLVRGPGRRRQGAARRQLPARHRRGLPRAARRGGPPPPARPRALAHPTARLGHRGEDLRRDLPLREGGGVPRERLSEDVRQVDRHGDAGDLLDVRQGSLRLRAGGLLVDRHELDRDVDDAAGDGLGDDAGVLAIGPLVRIGSHVVAPRSGDEGEEGRELLQAPGLLPGVLARVEARQVQPGLDRRPGSGLHDVGRGSPSGRGPGAARRSRPAGRGPCGSSSGRSPRRARSRAVRRVPRSEPPPRPSRSPRPGTGGNRTCRRVRRSRRAGPGRGARRGLRRDRGGPVERPPVRPGAR